MSRLYYLIIFVPWPLYANRLEDAAQRWTDSIFSIAQISSVAGIALGAILMTLGAVQSGKTILMGGVFAAVAIFGGHAFIDTLKGFFV